VITAIKATNAITATTATSVHRRDSSISGILAKTHMAAASNRTERLAARSKTATIVTMGNADCSATTGTKTTVRSTTNLAPRKQKFIHQ
jgi:uncharacterized membrane protein